MPIAKKIDSKKPAPEASSNMGEDFIVPLNGTPLSGKRHNGALPKDKVPKFGLDNEFIVKGKIIPDNNPFIFQVNLSETCMNAPRENGGQKIIGNANENN